ncbi:hypothetical protein SAMN05444487_11333 [Marininema mesophilum]|uniref:Uncharacterized protein n=1 Tax=Marininema mesophilum TaxID=1048340 RepID=A0A1H3AEE6_9BACL|nr:hypothetical protein [Marininema mesophilum]SDX27209.1 hypothetical protein SAMN05444487_11333 [Marininema mesophilum]
MFLAYNTYALRASVKKPVIAEDPTFYFFAPTLLDGEGEGCAKYNRHCSENAKEPLLTRFMNDIHPLGAIWDLFGCLISLG